MPDIHYKNLFFTISNKLKLLGSRRFKIARRFESFWTINNLRVVLRRIVLGGKTSRGLAQSALSIVLGVPWTGMVRQQ
jgi:hypothetical protein